MLRYNIKWLFLIRKPYFNNLGHGMHAVEKAVEAAAFIEDMQSRTA